MRLTIAGLDEGRLYDEFLEVRRDKGAQGLKLYHFDNERGSRDPLRVEE